MLMEFAGLCIAVLLPASLWFNRFHRRDQETSLNNRSPIDLHYEPAVLALPDATIDTAIGEFLDAHRRSHLVNFRSSAGINFTERGYRSFDVCLAA